MRCLVHSLIAFFFVSARTTDMDAAEPENRRFNVLFIAIDDLNKWALGLSDHSAARTPHMDLPRSLLLATYKGAVMCAREDSNS